MQEQLKHEADLEKNNGVWWQERLMAVPLQAGLVEQMGIKRSTDKVRGVVAHVHTMHYRLQLHHTRCIARLMPGRAYSKPPIATFQLLPCLMHAHVMCKNCAPNVNALHADPAAKVCWRCADVARCTQERCHAV